MRIVGLCPLNIQPNHGGETRDILYLYSDGTDSNIHH